LKELIPYSPGKPIDEVKRELGLEKVIKLASNESPLPPFPETLEAVEQALAELNRYPDGSCYLLKNQLSDHLDIPEKNLAVGNGSNELIRLIAQAILVPGDEVIAAAPSFVVYPTVTKMMNGKIIEVPLDQHRHDLPAMSAKISDQTKIIFICNPNNPTGTIVYKDEVDEFLKSVSDDIMVVFDEAYFEYVEDGRFPDGIDYFRQDRNVAVLRTFSKIYSLAGCRIGYGIVPEYLIDVLDRIREPFNVNALSQAAALASLGDRKEVAARVKSNAENKKYLYAGFERLGLSYVPSEANFILVDVKMDSKECFQKLLADGVIVRTGDIFGPGYGTFCRITIGTREENETLIEALEKVLNV
jgi:histidinol-phosphate aminotransferase